MSDPTQTGGQDVKLAEIERIADQVNAAQAKDLADIGDDGQLVERETSGERQDNGMEMAGAPADSAEERQENGSETAAPPAEQPAKPETMMIIVNGQQIEVSKDQIIEAGKRTLQKETAADKKLREAAELYKRAQQHFAALQKPAPSEQDAPQPAPATSVVDPEALKRELRGELRHELLMRDAENAENAFKQEFPEIASDPYLWSIVYHQEQQRVQHAAAVGEPLGSPLEAYRAHGKKIREWLGKRAPVAVEDKTEKKRAMVAVGGVNHRAAPPKEDKPQTVQEIIAQEAAARKAGRPIPQRTHR